MEAEVAVDRMLPAEATSATEARRLLRGALAEVEHHEAWDDAEVAVSEIVTNALVHAGTPMRLRVLLGDPWLRVELRDGSPHLPHRRHHSDVASTGRGLHVVGEVVDRWGAYPSEGGKVVWFEITPAEDEPAGDPTPRPPASDAVEIELLNVPLLMHAAWQEHAAALLRELLLIRLAEDETALESHAAASDALAVLFEQIPDPDIGTHPEAIMAAATEPGVSRSRIVLRVPPASLTHFDVLDSALVEAVALADAGELLAPPAQPEIQNLRNWLCAQVRGQAAGGGSTAWSSEAERLPVSPTQELDWDPGTVRESSRALLAADDTDQIVAVSPSALAMLGYVDAASLEGNRLISIIPARFHQAHIAGFTLHFVNGRSPLLGSRIRVPVIRADGSETELELQVDAVALPNGRRVFIAELGA